MAELGAAVLRLGSFWVQNSQKWELWVSKTTTTKKRVYFGLILGVFGSGGEKIGSLRAKQRPLLGGKRPFLVNGGEKKKSGVFGVKKSGFGQFGVLG